jgi:hypothetical protein
MRFQRPALAMLDEQVTDNEAQVRIVLAWNDVPYDGDSIGSSDGAARPRLVGEATLRAVERIIGDGTHLDLSGVATTDLGTARVAIAEVRLEGSLDSLVGSAVIRENDPAKATARAVLDAVNRRLELMLGK